MQYVVWNPEKHTVFIEEIDAQHRELISITNAAYRSKVRQEDRETISSVLNRLRGYVRYHFASEEALFARYNYPRASSHRSEHDFFAAKVTQLLVECKKPSSDIADDLLLFLRRWIVKHIRQEDRGYSTYFRSKGLLTSGGRFSDSAPAPPTLEDHELSETPDLNRSAPTVEFIAWNDEKLSVHITEIDAQHRELIAITNEVYALSTSPDDPVALGSILRRLLHYSEYHFATEHEAFLRFRYPESALHKREHEFFVGQVRRFAGRFREDKDSLSTDVLRFLKDWTIKHIRVQDRKFGNYFQKYVRTRKKRHET